MESARRATQPCARQLATAIAFLDADDLWEPAKTALQLAAFAADPGLQLAFGHVRQVVSPDLPTEQAVALSVPDTAQPGLYIGAMLARREAIETIGPSAEDVAVSDASPSSCALASSVGEVMLAETVILRRVHGANHSIQKRGERAEFARLLSVRSIAAMRLPRERAARQ